VLRHGVSFDPAGACQKIYGLPRAITEAGIVSYGFHGLSYSHIAAKLRDRYGTRAGGRAIVAHLGSGASLCAMDAGRSIATTMGFSTLDGLVMSTRCGALDAGVILHLLQDGGCLRKNWLRFSTSNPVCSVCLEYLVICGP
jgi:acetate kinase